MRERDLSRSRRGSRGVELELGTLKRADGGNGVILRVYDPNGTRVPVTLRFREVVGSVERVNLLEEPGDGSPIELIDGGRAVRFEVRPFELITLRLQR